MAINNTWISANGNVSIQFDSSVASANLISILSILQSSSYANTFFGDVKTLTVTAAPAGVGSQWVTTDTFVPELGITLYANTMYFNPGDVGREYIGLDGDTHSVSLQHLFIHELTHAIAGINGSYADLTDAQGAGVEGDPSRIIAQLQNPTADWLGDTVRLVNEVLSNIPSFGDAPRAHYLSNIGEPGLSPESAAFLNNESFTYGRLIDNVVQGSAFNSTAGLTITRVGSFSYGSTTVPSADLMGLSQIFVVNVLLTTMVEIPLPM